MKKLISKTNLVFNLMATHLYTCLSPCVMPTPVHHSIDKILCSVYFLLSDYGINSILYQRGIYPPESFTRVQKYGLTLLVTSDEKLKDYLNPVIAQIKGLEIILLCMIIICKQIVHH